MVGFLVVFVPVLLLGIFLFWLLSPETSSEWDHKSRTDPPPPRPQVAMRPPHIDHCLYCKRDVVPGSTETACLGCGAPIRPIPKLPEPIKTDDDGDYDFLMGDGKVIAVVRNP